MGGDDRWWLVAGGDGGGCGEGGDGQDNEV